MNDFTNFAKEYANRADRARASLVECIARAGGLNAADASKAFDALNKGKCLKYDGYNGVYSVKHGALMGREVLRRAAGLET